MYTIVYCLKPRCKRFSFTTRLCAFFLNKYFFSYTEDETIIVQQCDNYYHLSAYTYTRTQLIINEHVSRRTVSNLHAHTTNKYLLFVPARRDLKRISFKHDFCPKTHFFVIKTSLI